MADFDPPFASSGERRFPTSDEQSQGFGCGEADITLFRGMFHRIEAEIGNVLVAAGITQSNGDLTQLSQAIAALIDAATGGGETEGYVTMLQARARLPFFPDVQTVAGHFGMTSPSSGQVRVPAGVTFLHRGIFPITTVQTDLATDASKTYHVRWNPTDGFSINDLASGTYNPGTLAESDASFDTAYDDMLVARVITNSSNVPTITNLINRARMSASENQVQTDSIVGSGSPGFSYYRDMTFSYNFARAPLQVSVAAALGASAAGGTIGLDGVANLVRNIASTRYATTFRVESDFGGVPTGLYADATVHVSA